MVNNFFDYLARSALDVYEYNPINTLFFATVFTAAVFLIYKYIIKALHIKVDVRFLFGSSMWAFFAMSIRLLYDSGVTKSVLFITPYVTIIDFLLAVSALLLSCYIERAKGIEYWRTWSAAGAVLGLIALSFSHFNNWAGFGAVVALWTVWLAVLIGAKKIFQNFLTWWNIGVLEAHLMDASGSFIGITFFGFSEEHVLGGKLISYAETLGLTVFGSGAWVMFLLKLVVLLPVLYYIDSRSEDMQEAKYIKTLIFVLGFAVGLRNAFNILLVTS